MYVHVHVHVHVIHSLCTGWVHSHSVYMCVIFVVVFQSLVSGGGNGAAGVSDETQELLGRVAELQQEKWALEEKV